jgi:hypothetical protein
MKPSAATARDHRRGPHGGRRHAARADGGVDADMYEIEGADGSDAPRLIRELPWVHGVTQLGCGCACSSIAA